jgi:large subunit ribosomal protein L13
MKTYSPKPGHIEHRWYVLDASGQVLGRLATEVATLLRGKHKPIYAPHMDTGDHVIVINADKVELTGAKAKDKFAYRHSGYPGGITATPYGELIATRPRAAVERAVRGMLPKNTLGRQMLKKLHVVAGPEHPHAAQKPLPLAVGERPVWDGLPAQAPAETSAKAAPAATKSTAAEPKPKPKKSTATKPKSTAKSTAAEPKPKKSTAAKPKSTAKATATKTKAKAPASKSAPPKPTTRSTTAKAEPASETEE